jgi:hypothetical protein
VDTGFAPNHFLTEGLSGEVHVVWENWTSGPEVGWSRSTNGGFSFAAASEISSSARNAKWPLVAPVGKDESPAAVVTYWNAANAIKDLRSIPFNGTAFGSDAFLGVDGDNQYHVNGIAHSPWDGGVYRMFSQNVGGNWTLKYSRFNGTAWGPPVDIVTGLSYFPSRFSLAAGATGKLMAVWDSENSTAGRIFTPGQGWSAVTEYFNKSFFGNVVALPDSDDFYIFNPYASSFVTARPVINGVSQPLEYIGTNLPDSFIPFVRGAAGPDGTLYASWEYWAQDGATRPQAYYAVKPPAPAVPPLVPRGALWKYLDNGSDQGTAWRGPAFDDGGWAQGAGELGYGDSGDGRPEKTSVSFGSDPANKHRTTYFRHDFTVADPAAVSYLKLGLLRDDGAAVYLNGAEVARENLAAGAGYADLATAGVAGGDEGRFHYFSVRPSLLVPGVNTLAVEVHQSSPGSSDLSFDLHVEADYVTPGSGVLVPAGGTWKYLDDGSDQGTAWRQAAFDDRAWAFGRAQLGYGDGDETTALACGESGPACNQNNAITAYFRREFEVADPTRVDSLLLELVRDDGAAVYLNGVEVVRDNLGLAALFSDLATAVVSGAEESQFRPFTVAPASLVPGKNVLAVEVHQSGATSSDVSFDLKLTATYRTPVAQVVGRHVFYNNSAYDASGDDAAAVAPDKTALLPGQTATKAHYTSYNRGLNGLIIDIDHLANGAALSASDFEFRVGNNQDPGSWAPAPPPQSITVLAGAGPGGTDRVVLTWPDGAIQKQWLQVTVKATAATGLEAVDVFYFGNAVGESGNFAGNAAVNASDEIHARVNTRTFANPAPIDFHVDFNRDRLVNATDQIIARSNTTNAFTALVLLSPPGLPPLAAVPEPSSWVLALAAGLSAALVARQRLRAGREGPPSP